MLSWNGNIEAQRQADAAYSNLRPKNKRKRKGRRKPVRRRGSPAFQSKFISGYQKYIRSQEWQKKRKEAFKFYGRQCFSCGAVSNLVVHHLTYERFGNEAIEDLRILCKSCHDLLHKRN